MVRDIRPIGLSVSKQDKAVGVIGVHPFSVP
jgi:hypothetical protein